jgi:hypothetical protein
MGLSYAKKSGWRRIRKVGCGARPQQARFDGAGNHAGAQDYPRCCWCYRHVCRCLRIRPDANIRLTHSRLGAQRCDGRPLGAGRLGARLRRGLCDQGTNSADSAGAGRVVLVCIHAPWMKEKANHKKDTMSELMNTDELMSTRLFRLAAKVWASNRRAGALHSRE